ncbi:GvpL/GvpF family gas vesicle protein [Roseofilum casamattae]|uniref:GvpL/GvpF family gas vesicle protein n=1 Tax=Roseofilum casamattae BLCC-M143 TaxID=3022442 RepID=A0ABT7BXY2_9CYAN|nr:GvpL/GvpF family gas vesicle protein [Roseofilum casamattae]MDJ1184048.1 GvpL/GvpF family gas vesicle protein [Roseofilum casamattae BLCC-M143]
MYTYALIETPTTPLTLPVGLVGELELISIGEITAIAEPQISLQKMELLVQDDELLQQAYVRYGQAICDLFRQTTIVPLRFYHCFADRAALQQHLNIHKSSYRQMLKRLEGKGEYLLKFLPKDCLFPEAEKETLKKGKDYFLAKKKRYQMQQDYREQQQQDWQAIGDRILAEYPNAIVSNPSEDKREIYLLGDRDRESFLSQQLQIWKEECNTWHITLSEAIPPYDFLDFDL